MRRVVLVTVVLAALVAPSSALTARTPTGAAVKAAACLRTHGWTVRFWDHHRQIDARKQGWRYGVSFFRPYAGAKVTYAYWSVGVPDAELRAAQACRAAALR